MMFSKYGECTFDIRRRLLSTTMVMGFYNHRKTTWICGAFIAKYRQRNRIFIMNSGPEYQDHFYVRVRRDHHFEYSGF